MFDVGMRSSIFIRVYPIVLTVILTNWFNGWLWIYFQIYKPIMFIYFIFDTMWEWIEHLLEEVEVNRMQIELTQKDLAGNWVSK